MWQFVNNIYQYINRNIIMNLQFIRFHDPEPQIINFEIKYQDIYQKNLSIGSHSMRCIFSNSYINDCAICSYGYPWFMDVTQWLLWLMRWSRCKWNIAIALVFCRSETGYCYLQKHIEYMGDKISSHNILIRGVHSLIFLVAVNMNNHRAYSLSIMST